MLLLLPSHDAALADTDAEGLFKLQTAELKHGRLAMLGMLGIAIQAGLTDTTSPLENLANLGK